MVEIADPVAAIAAIDQFWAWWQMAHEAVARATDDNRADDFADEISRLVVAIDPQLEWELGKGRDTPRSLTVTAAGNFARRGLAERWYRQAPAPDDHWEYHPSRQRDGRIDSAALELGPHRIALADLACTVAPDRDRAVFDIAISHPTFTSLKPNARAQICFLALDWLLGEDGVEEWVGTIAQAPEPGPDWHPLASLREAVDQLIEVGVPESWARLLGEAPDGTPVVVTARRPLKRIRHPMFDLHLAIELAYNDQTAEGLPGPLADEQLQTFEECLIGLCAENGLVVAHATNAGLRSFDVYTDHASDLAQRLTVWSAEVWPGSSVRSELDPSWEAVDSLL